MVIGYDRIAYAGTYDPDFRVTFDTRITWRVSNLDLRSGTYGEEIIRPDQHLMEIKIPDAFPLELSHTLSELGIFPTSFSKYGSGYLDYLKEMSERNTINTEFEMNNNLRYLVHMKGDVAYA